MPEPGEEAMQAHTPGPWTVEGQGGMDMRTNQSDVYSIGNPPRSSQKLSVATCMGNNRRADARLTAAAPDLLEAAQALDFAGGLLCESPGWNLPEWEREEASNAMPCGKCPPCRLRKAIAKAKKEAPDA